jgi:hypothetical protein
MSYFIHKETWLLCSNNPRTGIHFKTRAIFASLITSNPIWFSIITYI